MLSNGKYDSGYLALTPESEYSENELNKVARKLENKGFEIEEGEFGGYRVYKQVEIDNSPIFTVPGFGEVKKPEGLEEGAGRILASLPKSLHDIAERYSPFSGRRIAMHLKSSAMHAIKPEDYKTLEETVTEELE